MKDKQTILLNRLNEIEKTLFGDNIPRDILVCSPETPWEGKTFPCRLQYLETNSLEIDGKLRKLNQTYTFKLAVADITARNQLASASQEPSSLTALLNSWDADIADDLAFWTQRITSIGA
jgi:hypothetical protein